PLTTTRKLGRSGQEHRCSCQYSPSFKGYPETDPCATRTYGDGVPGAPSFQGPPGPEAIREGQPLSSGSQPRKYSTAMSALLRNRPAPPPCTRPAPPGNRPGCAPAPPPVPGCPARPAPG